MMDEDDDDDDNDSSSPPSYCLVNPWLFIPGYKIHHKLYLRRSWQIYSNHAWKDGDRLVFDSSTTQMILT